MEFIIEFAILKSKVGGSFTLKKKRKEMGDQKISTM